MTPAQAMPPQTAELPRDDAPPTGSTRMAPDQAADATTSAPLTTVAGTPTSYTVASGDTVSGIAARFGVSTASLLARNGLSWKSLIFPGQVLALGGGSAPAPAPAPTPTPALAVTKYAVVAGDTISRIAGRFGVPTSAVLSANGLSSSSLIFPGQQITIPGMTTAAVVTPRPAAAPAPPSVAAPAPLPSATAGQVVALTDEMRGNAALIVRVGHQEGVSDQGIVVALAAAAQESGLRNVRYGDRDSLGLFQQRPSTGWGTAAQVLDPERATRAFFGGSGNPNPGRTRGLLDIPGWTSMTVTQAAQAVQISAYPDAYAKWETSARAWLTQLG
ncbi:LysM peptidoglycan-binding domain-containing protein [Leifsonia aquatica]|uniref:LysM peptidoglycan-binding domain-containing protein n=1 Tax=Leifsonia aquatica TaxID=144185 RepID=UPI003D2FEB48